MGIFILATRDCFNQNVLVYFSERLTHILLVKPLKHSYYTASKLVPTAPPQACPVRTQGDRNCLKVI